MYYTKVIVQEGLYVSKTTQEIASYKMQQLWL
jgi:hypothetical protein